MNRFALPILMFLAMTGTAFAQRIVEVEQVTVPEPATVLLVAAGAGYVLARRRKSRS